MDEAKYDSAFARLAKSKFRSRFRLSDEDREYISRVGIESIRRHCADFGLSPRLRVQDFLLRTACCGGQVVLREVASPSRPFG